MKHDIFNTEEILDESTLDIKILQDWHVDEVTGSTRQKLIEINVAEWWPGQDYRIPVRMIVPLEGKAKGFHITEQIHMKDLMKDSRPTDFQAKLLAGGVGIVKTHVKAFRQIPGKQGLEQKMGRRFHERPESAIHDYLDLVDDLNAGNHRGVCGGRPFRKRQSGRFGQLQERHIARSRLDQ